MLRVLHLPTLVAGNAWNLAQGERENGLDSTVLASNSSKLDYPSDINLNLENIKHKPLKLLKLTSTFFKIRNKYDIFHFNYGSSLIHLPEYKLNQLDVPFYPKGSRLFVTYNGCDIRQKYVSMRNRTISPCHNERCSEGLCNSGIQDVYRRLGASKMSKYVSHIWALNPDLLHFLPEDKSSFLPYAINFSSKNAPKKDLKKK